MQMQAGLKVEAKAETKRLSVESVGQTNDWRTE
jgi:hypothetical protein